MITRIVRMEFKPEHVQDFLRQFDSVRHKIRQYPGVQKLELHHDTGQSNVFYTYSTWDSEQALETYRQSELFKYAWGAVKPWFGSKPQAFSLRPESLSEEEQDGQSDGFCTRTY